MSVFVVIEQKSIVYHAS